MQFIKNNSKFFLIIIIIIQVLLVIYWGGRRENFYWDEYFTFEKTHYLTSSTPKERYVSEDPDLRINEWMPISFVNDMITVKKSQSIFYDPPGFLFKRIVGYNSPFVLLNAVEALFFEGKVSIWPGIIINILFLVLNQLALYRLSYLLSKKELQALFSVAFYGFSSICLSMSTFVRFYMFVTLMTTLFVLLHLEYWQASPQEYFKKLLYLGGAFFSLYIGYNNAQFMVILGGFFIICFAVGLLVKKGVIQFLLYSVPVFGGGIWYLSNKTDYLNVFTDFDSVYSSSSGAMSWALEQIAGFRTYMLPGRISDMAKILGRYLFGSVYFMLLVAAVFAMLVIYALIHRKENKPKAKEDGIFLYIIMASAVMFLLFFMTFGLYEQVRYISFVFPLCAIAVMWLPSRLINQERIGVFAMFIILFIQVLSVNIKGKVDMLYTGDREQIERIRSENADSIMLIAGNHIDHIAYQSTLFVDNDAEFFVYDGQNIEKAEKAFREDMLVIQYNSVRDEIFEKMLREKGYELEQIGWTYELSAYKLCEIGQ